MASLFQTMFVSPSSPPTFPHDPKALPPVATLVESTPCPKDDAPTSGKGASTTSPSWLARGLFNSPQLQALFGARKGQLDDIDRRSLEPSSPKSVPRASIESLRDSLEALHRPLSPEFSQAPKHANLQDISRSSIDSVVSRSNSKARGPFKPQKTSKGTSSWQLRQFAEATLGSGSLRKAVKLPEGEDINEWLAVNVVDFYNQINLLYGSITEFCSPQTCPEMKATDEFEYLWQDSENFKRPTKMPAPEYIEHLMTWCQSNIDNEQLFPSRIGVAFPKTFPSLVRQMFKRLYRVYAHIYCHHYPVIIQLGLEPHLNTSFKHYVLFVDEHQLSTGKDFWGPLGDLVESMLRSD